MKSPASDLLAVNTLRFLAVDMVEQAGCGHPGAPMGQAPLAYVLWTRLIRHSPEHPEWPNRDRFVLSCGHASALLYGLLHLSGHGLDLGQLRRFRQLGSQTAGHPEYRLAPGIETTTGPLGQGVGNAVGMALGQRLLAHQFNREGFALFDHRTWALASDGDLMEGVASEACSLAGHLRLGHLNVLYDANQITIDGSTELSFGEDVAKRFEAYGWHTLAVDDGNDLDALEAAMGEARGETGRPSLVLVRTHIGYGSPNKQGTAAAHGAALGEAEVEATKQALSWPLEPTFYIPDEARRPFDEARLRGCQAHDRWVELRRRYEEEHPKEAAELRRREAGGLPEDWARALPSFEPGGAMATRSASGKVLNALAGELEELVGGSADLTGSNNTLIEGELDFSAGAPARNLRFGVREHGMGAILNGLALSKLIRPYGGTFLIFSDYMRPSIRLAALMGLPVVYILTHDSIFLGEDGPTHQPISQLAALRAIPNLTVIRPADANETATAWKVAIERRQGPVALILTRQKVPTLPVAPTPGLEHGAYVRRDAAGELRAILLASGSEVALALDAQTLLEEKGVATRVVSVPSWELFEAAEGSYRQGVLPPTLTARVAIEAASPLGWERYVGDRGEILGISRFGESAPAADLYEPFGFTAESIAARVEKLLDRSST